MSTTTTAPAVTCTDRDNHRAGAVGCAARDCQGIPSEWPTVAATAPAVPFPRDGEVGVYSVVRTVSGKLARVADVDRVPFYAESNPYGRPVRSFGVWEFNVNATPVHVVTYESRGALDRGPRSLAALFVAGDLVTGAGSLSTARGPADLGAEIAWRTARHLTDVVKTPALSVVHSARHIGPAAPACGQSLPLPTGHGIMRAPADLNAGTTQGGPRVPFISLVTCDGCRDALTGAADQVAEAPAVPVDQADAVTVPTEAPAAPVDQVDADAETDQADADAPADVDQDDVGAWRVPFTDAPQVLPLPSDWSGAPAVWAAGVDVAKLIRDALKSYFPGVKFSVRTDVSTVAIRWTDGPTVAAVDLVTRDYAGQSFDGMQDMRTYRGDVLVIGRGGTRNAYRLGTDFVQTSRESSAGLVESMRPAAAVMVGRELSADPRTDHFPHDMADEFGVLRGPVSGWEVLHFLARTRTADMRGRKDTRPVCTAPGPAGRTCELAAGHAYPLVHLDSYGRPYLARPAGAVPAPAAPVIEAPALDQVDQVDAGTVAKAEAEAASAWQCAKCGEKVGGVGGLIESHSNPRTGNRCVTSNHCPIYRHTISGPAVDQATPSAVVRPRCTRAVPAPAEVGGVACCNAPADQVSGGIDWCGAHVAADRARGFMGVWAPLPAEVLAAPLAPAHPMPAPAEAPAPITAPVEFRFTTTAEAYTATQTRDDIRDGDVLVIESERVAGFLMRAWPVAVTAATGELHGFDGDPRTAEGGRYAESADRAHAIAWTFPADGDDQGDGGAPAPADPVDGPDSGAGAPADVDQVHAVHADVAAYRARTAEAGAPAATVDQVDAPPAPAIVTSVDAVPLVGGTMVVSGMVFGLIVRAARRHGVDGFDVMTGGAYTRHVDARTVRPAVVGATVCAHPCTCAGRLHMPAVDLVTLPRLAETPDATADQADAVAPAAGEPVRVSDLVDADTPAEAGAALDAAGARLSARVVESADAVKVGPGVTVISGFTLGNVVRADRQNRADGWQIASGGAYTRFSSAWQVKPAVVGANVCRTPERGCYCGMMHVSARELATLPRLAETLAAPVDQADAPAPAVRVRGWMAAAHDDAPAEPVADPDSAALVFGVPADALPLHTAATRADYTAGPNHGTEPYRARRIRVGDLVTAYALHDTTGARMERVTLVAEESTRLGCGCERVRCTRPGPTGTGTPGVALLTGCGFHPCHVADSAPAGTAPAAPVVTPDMLAEAERLGREAYGFNAPAAPAADGALTGPAGMVAGWPVGAGAADVFAAWSRGYAAEGDRAAADVLRVIEGNAVAQVQAEKVAALNPAAEWAVDQTRAAGESLARTLQGHTARAEAARATVDQADTDAPAQPVAEAPAPAGEGGDQGDAGDVYTLPLQAYAPVLDSDQGGDLVIEHSHEDGTVLHGGAKGDGTLDIVAAYRFVWRRGSGVHIPASRDRFADLVSIDKAAKALRAAGHTVAVVIDDVWRPAAVREGHRAERAADRAERLGERAMRRFGEAEARRLAARRIGDSMPFGEPAKKGHHSYARHMRAFEKIASNDRASHEAREYAQHLASRASGSEANEAAKHGPRAIMRRVERLEVEARSWARELADPQTGPGRRRRAELETEKITEDVAFQRAKLGDMAAAGAFVAWSREHFQAGDWANVAGRWCEVARVNRKGVSVYARFEWVSREAKPQPTTWDEIHGRRRDGLQWDAPNAEPRSVEEASRVATWGRLLRSLAVNHDRIDDEAMRQRRHVQYARRVVLGLGIMATVEEIEAFGEPADVAGKRARALAMMAAYDRFTAGETFAQVSADTAPIGDTVPAWRMPTGETVRLGAGDLAPGDIVAGAYDRLFSHGERLVRSMVGPVQSVPVHEDRRESGDWYTVKINGEVYEVRAARRFAVHQARKR